jgi:hypothetical protein
MNGCFAPILQNVRAAEFVAMHVQSIQYMTVLRPAVTLERCTLSVVCRAGDSRAGQASQDSRRSFAAQYDEAARQPILLISLLTRIFSSDRERKGARLCVSIYMYVCQHDFSCVHNRQPYKRLDGIYISLYEREPLSIRMRIRIRFHGCNLTLHLAGVKVGDSLGNRQR